LFYKLLFFKYTLAVQEQRTVMYPYNNFGTLESIPVNYFDLQSHPLLIFFLINLLQTHQNEIADLKCICYTYSLPLLKMELVSLALHQIEQPICQHRINTPSLLEFYFPQLDFLYLL